METTTISINVDPDTARAFAEASDVERRKLEILLSLRLRALTVGRVRPLKEIMDEIGAQAEARGLTQEFLDAMLDDEHRTDCPVVC
jgi:hypothetical protein